LLKKAELFKTVIPTKMLEFMSCARPVISSVEGESRKILETAGAGIYVEPENPEQLAQAILRLAENDHLRKTLGGNGRRYIVQNLSRRHTAQTYINVLMSIMGKSEKKRSAAA